MRTLVNLKNGGQTRASGVIHSLFLLSLLLGLAPLASQIPLAVLAGILIKVGIDILDYRLLRLLKRAPKPETLIMGVVFLLTVLVDLIVAVGAGVVLAMGLLTWRVAREAQINFYEPSRSGDPLNLPAGVRMIRMKGPIFFGSATQMLDRMDKVNEILDIHHIILDCRQVSFMDLSAIFALDDMVKRIQERGIGVRVIADLALQQELLHLHTANLTEAMVFTRLDAVVDELSPA